MKNKKYQSEQNSEVFFKPQIGLMSRSRAAGHVPNLSNKKVLVTGGSGFLGTVLVEKLLEQKRKVIILDLKSPQNKDVEFIQANVTDFNTFRNSAKNVEVIFHLASLVPQSKVNVEDYEKVIVGGTENALRICKEKKIKLIHVSSSSVYGGKRDGILKEEDPKNPAGPYACAKWNAELKCQEYAKQRVDVVILRPMAIVGPGIYGVFKKFLQLIKMNLPLITFGDGSNRIQLLHVSDCADALLCAENYDKSGEVFNLGSENVPTVKEEFRELIKHAKSKSVIISIPANLARFIFKSLYKIKLSPLTPEHYYLLDKNSIADITKAKKLLGWMPKRDNITTLQETYDWYVSNSTK
jgi:dTDP-glucose 4,6-dehydratase